MKKFYLFSIIMLLSLCSYTSHAQGGKYYEITVQRFHDSILAMPRLKNNQESLFFAFKGHSQKQIYDEVMAYIASNPTFLLKQEYITDNQIVYRHFCTIGKKDSCFADLYGLLYIVVRPQKNGLNIFIDWGSRIFATLDNAELHITGQDDVASIDDKPFNYYSYFQERDDTTYLPGPTPFSKSRPSIMQYSLAYGDAIYNYNGRVITNQHNKDMIERLYDNYILNIVNYLQQKLK